MNSFSANILANTVDLIKSGLRDLRSSNLTTYTKPLAPIDVTELKNQVAQAQTFRSTEYVQSQSAAEIANQIATPVSNERFRSLLADAGLESTYSEDLVEAKSADLVPEVGAPTLFSQRKADQGATLTVEQIRAGLAQLTAVVQSLETPESSLHITQPAPRERTDESPRVFSANKQMLNYVRDYTKVGQ